MAAPNAPTMPIPVPQTAKPPLAETALYFTAPAKPPVVDTVRAKEGGIQLGGTVVTSMQVGKGGIEALVEDVFGVMVTFRSVRPDKVGAGGKIRIPWANIACVVYANDPVTP